MTKQHFIITIWNNIIIIIDKIHIINNASLTNLTGILP